MPTIILKTPNEEVEVPITRKQLMQVIEYASKQNVRVERLLRQALEWYLPRALAGRDNGK